MTSLLAAILAGSAAPAQYHADFEPPGFAGSPTGLPLAGQDGFYVPDTLLDLDALCFTYLGNVLGVADNPAGGSQFTAATRGPAAFARAQRDVDLSDPAPCWTVEVDVNLLFAGVLPANNYAASLSLQPYPEPGSIVLLFYWDDPQTADTYTVRVLGFDADGGTPFLAGLPIANDAFHGVPANTWQRLSLRVQFGRNALTAISIQDLQAAQAPAGFIPTDLEGFYLGGGDTPGARPTAFRLFGGGGFPSEQIAGNTLAIDNLSLAPSGQGDCLGDITLNGEILLSDIATLLVHFGVTAGAAYTDGDLDCDADVDRDDLAILLRTYGLVCP